MKKLIIAALIAGQMTIAAQPALAAELVATQERQMGAFAGFRVRMPLGADPGREGLRAGLALAPTLHSRSDQGAYRMRFGEGLELGISRRQPLTLNFGGARIDRLGLAPNGQAPGGPRANLSTAGWIAVSVGVLGATSIVLFVLADDSCDDLIDGDC